MLWAVNAADSLFVYMNGRNHSDYQEPDFRPMFKNIRPEDLPEEGRNVCRDNVQCAYDYVATGNNSKFARGTIAVLDKANETSSNLSIQVSKQPLRVH